MTSREGEGGLPGNEQEPERNAPAPLCTLHGVIKKLFGEVAQALTQKSTPSLAFRHKRREEAAHAFRLAARQFVHRIAHLPAEAYTRATTCLADTLDWLNLWHHHEEVTEEVQPAASDHLYPHL